MYYRKHEFVARTLQCGLWAVTSLLKEGCVGAPTASSRAGCATQWRPSAVQFPPFPSPFSLFTALSFLSFRPPPSLSLSPPAFWPRCRKCKAAQQGRAALTPSKRWERAQLPALIFGRAVLNRRTRIVLSQFCFSLAHLLSLPSLRRALTLRLVLFRALFFPLAFCVLFTKKEWNLFMKLRASCPSGGT